MLRFSTLYTNIPHGKPIVILNEHMDHSFEGGDGSFIEVDRYDALWSNT